MNKVRFLVMTVVLTSFQLVPCTHEL